jgi:hypothetical protein
MKTGSCVILFPIKHFSMGKTMQLFRASCLTPVFLRLQLHNEPFASLGVNSAPIAPINFHITLVIQNVNPTLSQVHQGSFRIDCEIRNIPWRIPLLPTAELLSTESGWILEDSVRFEVTFSEFEPPPLEQISTVLKSDTIDDTPPPWNKDLPLSDIPELFRPLRTDPPTPPLTVRFTLPLMVQYGPEKFTAVTYAGTEWIIHLEPREGIPTPPIVVLFRTVANHDRMVKFTLNLEVPKLGRDQRSHTVLPHEQLFEIELGSRASGLRSHSKLDFSLTIEEVHTEPLTLTGTDEIIGESEEDGIIGLSRETLIRFGLLIPGRPQKKKSPPNFQFTKIETLKPFVPTMVGCVGLKYEGIVGYLISMLQVLFSTTVFRRFIYETPMTGSENPATSFILCLQRLFSMMQLGKQVCSISAVAKSFGWDEFYTRVGHDVSEFMRTLINKIEGNLKGTPLEGRIAALFRGKRRYFVRCPEIDFKSYREEEFYDLSVGVKGFSDLTASIKKSVEVEKLTGANQYDFGNGEKRDALKGQEFLELPPILHIQLKRFEYDNEWNTSLKIHDRLEFPTTLDLSTFLPSPSVPAIYDLYGIVLHTGSPYVGHYCVYLRSAPEPKWIKFNNSVVAWSSPVDAVDGSFGTVVRPKNSLCPSFHSHNFASTGTAYRLIYVRQADADMVFQGVDRSFIPQHLQDYALHPEGFLIANPNLEITISGDMSIAARCHQGRTGFDCCSRYFSATFTRATATHETLYQVFCDLFHRPVDEIEIFTTWIKFTPCCLLANDKTSLANFTSKQCFVRMVQEETATSPSDTVYFLKFFNPNLSAPLQYIGSISVNSRDPVRGIFPDLSGLLEFPEGTEYIVWEEMSSTEWPVRLLSDIIGPPTGQFAVRALIFETVNGILPDTPRVWDEPVMSDSAESEEKFNHLPLFQINPVSISVNHFLRGNVNVVVALFETPELLVARVSFPHTISVPELTSLLCSSTFVHVLSCDTALIYLADLIDPVIPARVFLDPIFAHEVNYYFREKKEYRIFLRVVRGFSLAEIRAFNDITVEFSSDCVRAARSIRLLIDYTNTVSEIRKHLVSIGFIPDVQNLRFWILRRNSVQRVITNIARETLPSGAHMRVDLIPPEQDSPGQNRRVVQVAFRLEESFLVAVGTPFFFLLPLDETAEAVRTRLRSVIRMDEAEWKKKMVLLTKIATPMLLSHGFILKGTQTIREIMAASKVDLTDLYLFIVERVNAEVPAKATT